MSSTGPAREVIRWCRQLAGASEDRPAITRTFLSRPMREVHTALAEWMARAGMSVRVDAAGNLRGVYSANGPQRQDRPAARFHIGSHLDTVPNGGAFDGVLGVVVGVALVDLLKGRRLSYDIEVVGFSDEEGTRFGTPFLGSSAFAGTFDAAWLDLHDAAGRTMRDAIRSFGLDPARISDAKASAGSLGYLEFHIEQGPVLESRDRPLAVVDVISGQSRFDVTFTGSAAHAGTTPMLMRQDALAAAAEWIGEVEREARSRQNIVATVGRLAVEPGATNVVPARAVASLDVRHPDDDIRHRATEQLIMKAEEIGERRRIAVSSDERLSQPSVAMDPSMAAMLDRALAGAGYASERLTSGAGHDAMIVAHAMPVCMLFVRCAGGISHHPAEDVREEDVAAALDTGLLFLDELDRDRRG
jgi:allantoate deiminase